MAVMRYTRGSGGVSRGALVTAMCAALAFLPDAASAQADRDCRDGRPGMTSTELVPGAGPAAGAMIGYATGGLRFEVEYLNAAPGSAESPIGSTTSTALQSKTSEWSTEQPPFEWVGEYKVHQVFANVLYDFRNGSRWNALSEHTSLGVALRWAQFGEVEHEAVYGVVRSHAGVLADGVTPFNNELTFSGIGYQALTVNLKYHF